MTPTHLHLSGAVASCRPTATGSDLSAFSNASACGSSVRSGRPSRLRVEGFVDANDALELKKGQATNVIIMVAKTPQNLLGKVVFVSPTANPANGQIRIFIEVENREARFRPGMTVAATIAR